MVTTMKANNAVKRDLDMVVEAATHRLSPTSPVLALLQNLASAVTRGADVTVLPHDQELTPTEAASLINISRQHLLTYLNSGVLTSTTVGTHRRIKVVHLLDFNERRKTARADLGDARKSAQTAQRRHPGTPRPLSDAALTTLDTL
ncbi:helix-turn-helix domain-containing protein [Cellulomonas sp. Y8]|uniref:helix-turn-helix domain-containing protein n=1 Tax=Cellulomonas sp. Y8 TaxID=2591145 RepID=UPI0011CA841C|nr:helix-turn-helix domain-containing protein [Cellulomonas sp. Y8]